MTLCQDPELPPRTDWVWCPKCQAIQPQTHAHDEFESMTREELLRLVRLWSQKSVAVDMELL